VPGRGRAVPVPGAPIFAALSFLCIKYANGINWKNGCRDHFPRSSHPLKVIINDLPFRKEFFRIISSRDECPGLYLFSEDFLIISLITSFLAIYL
jgi:hypothetical protein